MHSEPASLACPVNQSTNGPVERTTARSCIAVMTLDCGENGGKRLYLLMLWPSACASSCPGLRDDDGSVSRAGHMDSELGSVADR